MSSLKELAISDTQLRLDLINIPSVTALGLSWLNFSGVEFIFPINKFTSLGIANCGFVFKEQSVSLENFSSAPSWMNNDMSLVTITNFMDFSSYHFAGSKIHGNFDFDK